MTQNKPIHQSVAAPDRQRVTVDLSPTVLSLLDNYCEVTGQSRSAVVNSLVVSNLAALIEQSQAIKRTARDLSQVKR